MLSGVGILCIAGSYAVALALEVSRLLFRSGVRGAAMILCAGAGLLAHSAFLYHRALKTTGYPLSSQRDWCLLAAWGLVVVYLYLIYYHPRAAWGLFILPLALGLVGAATFADKTPFALDRASRIWGMLHGTSIVLAAVAVLVGFAAGLMYLGQTRRLRRKRPPGRGLRLPSLEWLRRANSRATVVALVALGVGVLSGMVLGRVRAAAVAWNDPIVLSTTAMFVWLLAAVAVGAIYRPAQEGRKVAYLTVVSFLFLIIVVGVFLLRRHGRGGKEGPAIAHMPTSSVGMAPGMAPGASTQIFWTRNNSTMGGMPSRGAAVGRHVGAFHAHPPGATAGLSSSVFPDYLAYTAGQASSGTLLLRIAKPFRLGGMPSRGAAVGRHVGAFHAHPPLRVVRACHPNPLCHPTPGGLA